MTCLEKKGEERREGIREYVGCQEGEEGPTLTGEWAGIRVRPLREQAYACDGVIKEWAEETHGQRSGKIARYVFSLLILTAFSYLLFLIRETAVPGPLGIEDISPSMSPDDKSFTRITPRVPDSTKRVDTGAGASRRSDSPEIPFQAAAGPSDGLDASSPGNSFVGLRVVAKWSSNGYFYSGKITQDVGAGKYKLLFDDGYECDVLGKDILLCDPIPLDTEVTALSEDEYFSAGNKRSICRDYCSGAVLSCQKFCSCSTG